MNALTPTPTDREQETAPQLFTRVLVGIDGSPESAEAARQAALLAAPDGKTTLLAAWTVPPPTVGGISGQSYSHELDAEYYRRRTEDTLAKARSALEPPAETETRAVRGVAWRTLIEQAAAEKATVLVVGSHGQGRIKGILLGSTATEVVHKAPCSVLVAREAGELFPRRVVVGVDGSPESAAAYAAARAIAARFESELWPVVARGGKTMDRAAVEQIVGHHYDEPADDPVPALLAASADADLLVVGSRGLHGFKALGSVSERVAHEAHCSTLIVRGLVSRLAGS